MTTTRRVIVTIVVIFLIYAILNDPGQSANVTSNAWKHIQNGLSNIGTFFDDLLSR